MTPKTFDCVEMKRKGSLRIYEQTKDMSVDEQVEYWRRKTDEMMQRQSQRKGLQNRQE